MRVRSVLETVENHLWSNARVSIRPLKTEADLIYAAYECQLNDWQKELVNPAWFSIGRAYLFRDDNYPCIICNEQMTPIGFINLCKWLGEGDAFSWSYYLDKNHQGKGYGKSAAEAAIQILKAASPDQPKAKRSDYILRLAFGCCRNLMGTILYSVYRFQFCLVAHNNCEIERFLCRFFAKSFLESAYPRLSKDVPLI